MHVFCVLEFCPGVPWKGLQNIDPENDPNMTPGSVPSGPTINTNIHDVNRYLLRDRNGGMTTDKGPNISTTNSPTEKPCFLKLDEYTLVTTSTSSPTLPYLRHHRPQRHAAQHIWNYPFFGVLCLLTTLVLYNHIATASPLQNGSLSPISSDWPISGYSRYFSLSSSDGDASGTHPRIPPHVWTCWPFLAQMEKRFSLSSTLLNL